MKYELAKKLKDAGFPQFGEGHALIPHKKLPESDETMDVINWQTYVHNTSLHHKEMMYAPTLSELIEACGQGYFNLESSQLGWSARNPLQVDLPIGNGSTSSEAVSHLWLELKKLK